MSKITLKYLVPYSFFFQGVKKKTTTMNIKIDQIKGRVQYECHDTGISLLAGIKKHFPDENQKFSPISKDILSQ